MSIKAFLTLILITITVFLNGESLYRVQSGDTLYKIANRYSVDASQIMALNQLKDGTLYVDMELTIPDRNTYIVQPGDTLSALAVKFDIQMRQLKEWNNLQNDQIQVGQTLKVRSDRSLVIQEYEVRKNDTLWAIAERFGLSVEEILKNNPLNGDTIFPGMTLSLGTGESALMASLSPGLNRARNLIENYVNMDEKGPWFNGEPDRQRQPSMDYSQLNRSTPLDLYWQAKEVLEDLDKEIAEAGTLSDDLRQWRIVIDPGHGGLDPGALVQTTDGRGNSAYVVEDEYAYDIAVRLYSLLKQNGAETYLTLISPNHHIRSTPDASATFVNQKNEVFNLRELNQSNQWSDWPRGGTTALRKRKTVASYFIGRSNQRTLFISIHCDNTPGVSYDNALLYFGANQQDINNSKALAESMGAELSGITHIRSQELEILKNNPAESAVLVEVRNIAQSENSWILRKDELRNQEVENLYSGIRSYILSQ